VSEKLSNLFLLERRLKMAGDESGAEKVKKQIALVQDNCSHKAQHSFEAKIGAKDPRWFKKGDLLTVCTFCRKLLKPPRP
jgi:hypothetical protein